MRPWAYSRFYYALFVAILLPHVAESVVFFNEQCAVGVSPSFFRPRSLVTDCTFELAQENYNNNYAYENHAALDVYIRPMFQQNFYASQTAQYFMPRHVQTASIAPNNEGELSPVWFQLVSYTRPTDPAVAADSDQYYSFVSMEPQRSVAGCFVTFQAYPSCRTFLQVHSFVGRIHHNLNVIETGRSINADVYSTTLPVQPSFKRFCQAVNSNAWLYGNIPCEHVQTTWFDDVQLRGGAFLSKTERFSTLLYAVGTVPAGRPSQFRGYRVFEPIIGSLQGSVGGGVNIGGCLFFVDQASMWLMMDARINYFLSSTEKRTFDLTSNGDWSRYLLLQTKVSPDGTIPKAIPGANILTLDTRVRPGAQFQLWLGLHLDVKTWQFEVGCTNWLRQHERLEPLAGQIPADTYGILDAFGSLYDVPPTPSYYFYTSASQAAIWLSGAAQSDPVFTPFNQDDLSLVSAAHPFTGSVTWYASLGYALPNTSVFIALNASVENAYNRAALYQSAWWGTLAFLF